MSDAILQVRDLRTEFRTEGGVVRAVDGVSFEVDRGQTLGIVGESGSGKSVTNLSILRLIPDPPGRITGGTIRFAGKDLRSLSGTEMRRIRGKRISMIFQDPMTSLNPYLRIGTQLGEVLELHEHATRADARRRSIEMLERVGIPDASGRIDRYPHEFSGGMRQRVMIAMALLCKPEVLIADEPTTALDVTIQAQILDLIREMRDELGMAVILITHDLGVVAGMADEVAVMYAGRVVEEGRTTALFRDPRHPYTLGLLRSIPRLDSAPGRLVPIPGRPPDLARLGGGCPFVPRCEFAAAVCRAELPRLRAAGDVAGEHTAACWHEAETIAVP
jgi:peptide/nickel transport system ATP-binding protein/oligopeptide transport system ATP-binding protein